jgi:hypothetical protein
MNDQSGKAKSFKIVQADKESLERFSHLHGMSESQVIHKALMQFFAGYEITWHGIDDKPGRKKRTRKRKTNP